jgi:inner membrane protein
MPSSVGHGLAGLAVVWFLEALRAGRRLPPAPARGLAAVCLLLAVVPDLDIVTTAHRGPSHSLGAVLAVAGTAAAVAARRRLPPLFVGTACGLAYASHLLLDWLGRDRTAPSGIMALWPFSTRHFLSGADLFLGISRRYWNPQEFIAVNLWSIAWELVLLLPVAALAYWMAKGRSR